jgi:dTDP-glucose pyrophosphorylase
MQASAKLTMGSVDKIGPLKISAHTTVADVIARIQASGAVACALLYDEQGKFINVITDGDVRRAFLAGYKLDDPAIEIQRVKARTARPRPITARMESSVAERESLFRKFSLRQLVLVDPEGVPVSIVDHRTVNQCPHYMNQGFTALIMAGGFGTRMQPYTEATPKPMLKVNGRPMLEISIEKLVCHGATRIFISTHYLPEKIIEHFGDGHDYGIEIGYVHEDVPRGTGGALSFLPFHDENTLVFNGDILTNLDVRMLLAHHLTSGSAMTIAACQYAFQVPFGVITASDALVTRIDEKPSFSFLVNSGIYFISKSVFGTLPVTQCYNMTDVAERLIRRDMRVTCFPVFEHWLDVGRPSDYEMAAKLF